MKAMVEIVKMDVKDIVTASGTVNCGAGVICIDQDE